MKKIIFFITFCFSMVSTAMAEKAAQLASRIIRGAGAAEIGPVVEADRAKAMINHKVVAKLNIVLTREDK